MTSTPSLIIDKDGNLDIELLSKEIAGDLSFDSKYRNEDSMKKRAIHASKSVSRVPW